MEWHSLADTVNQLCIMDTLQPIICVLIIKMPWFSSSVYTINHLNYNFVHAVYRCLNYQTSWSTGFTVVLINGPYQHSPSLYSTISSANSEVTWQGGWYTDNGRVRVNTPAIVISRDISWTPSHQLVSFKFRFLSRYNAQGIVTELVGSWQTSPRHINLPDFNPGFNISRALSLVRFN